METVRNDIIDIKENNLPFSFNELLRRCNSNVALFRPSVVISNRFVLFSSCPLVGAVVVLALGRVVAVSGITVLSSGMS